MSRTAYVVAHIFQDGPTWVLKGIGVYSESGMTLTGAFGSGRFAADIFHSVSHSYQEASELAIWTLVRRMPWCREYLGAYDKVTFDREMEELEAEKRP